MKKNQTLLYEKIYLELFLLLIKKKLQNNTYYFMKNINIYKHYKYLYIIKNICKKK